MSDNIKKPRPRESSIEDYLLKKCKQHGVFVVKNTGMNGIADRLLIKNGLCVFVELKRPGEDLRKLQKAIRLKLVRHGAIVKKADTKARVDDVVSLFLDPGIMDDRQKRRMSKLYRLLAVKIKKQLKLLRKTGKEKK